MYSQMFLRWIAGFLLVGFASAWAEEPAVKSTANIDFYVAVQPVAGETTLTYSYGVINPSTGGFETRTVVVPGTAFGEDGIANFDADMEGAAELRTALNAAVTGTNGTFDPSNLQFRTRTIYFIRTDSQKLMPFYNEETAQLDLTIKDGKSGLLAAFTAATASKTGAFRVLVGDVTSDGNEQGIAQDKGMVSVVQGATLLDSRDSGVILSHEIGHNLGLEHEDTDQFTDIMARQTPNRGPGGVGNRRIETKLSAAEAGKVNERLRSGKINGVLQVQPERRTSLLLPADTEGDDTPRFANVGAFDSASAGSNISFTFGGSIGERQPKKQTYLATEFGGLLTIGVMSQNRNVTETSWDIALRYAGEFSDLRVADENSDRSDAGNFFNPGNLVHELKFGGSHGSSSESFADFDPGTGVGLGIPGTGDGMFPAGIFLADLPGASNDVIGSWGRFEVDSFEAGYRGGYEFDAGAGFSLQPFVGLGYRHTSEKQSFGGSIPGYGIDFMYDTRLRLNAFKTEIGARLEHQLSDTVSIFGEPSVSLNFIGLDGWDGLELTGLVSDSQRVDLDRNEIQPGVKLAVGFDWEPVDSPFSVYAGAVVAHEPTTATVFRSGELGEQSEAKVKYATSYGVSASISLNF